jgi:hypothetical protein
MNRRPALLIPALACIVARASDPLANRNLKDDFPAQLADSRLSCP